MCWPTVCQWTVIDKIKYMSLISSCSYILETDLYFNVDNKYTYQYIDLK